MKTPVTFSALAGSLAITLITSALAFGADNTKTSRERSLTQPAKKVPSATNTNTSSTKKSTTTGNTSTTANASKSAKTPVPAEAAEATDTTAAKQYELRYKFKSGDVVRYDVIHRASIRSTIDDTTQAAQSRTDSVKAWKITDVLPEGDIEFTNVVEKVHMVNQLPDKDPVEYNSERDKTPPPGFEDAAKAVGVPLSVMRITPRGKVVRRDSKIRNQNVEEDAPIVLRLPEEKVAVGDTWDEPFDVAVRLPAAGATKSIQTRRHHKLASVENGVATIEVKYQVLSPIDAQIETQIVQRLMEGEVRFDINKGQVITQQMDVDKHIIGFAGATSSLQYIMKMEERLIPNEATVASKPKPQTQQKTTAANNRRPAPKNTNTNTKPQPKSTPQTASRPKTTQSGGRTIRR